MARRALVIDDSLAMRRILGNFLREQGFEVRDAGGARDGLSSLRHDGGADLVLVDWNMPEMSGIDFVRAVRADRAWDATRLMMVTTESESSRVSMALDAGADEFVMKPFTREIIADKLALLGLR